MRQYIKITFIVTALLLALVIALSTGKIVAIPAAIFPLIPAYAILSILLFRNVVNAAQKNARRYTTAFMGSVTIKLLFTMTFVAIAIYLDRANKVPIALITMGVYVVYTTLMVIFLKKEAEKKGNSHSG